MFQETIKTATWTNNELIRFHPKAIYHYYGN